MVVKHFTSKDWIFESCSAMLTLLIQLFDGKFEEALPHQMTSVLWGLSQLGRRSFQLRLAHGTSRDLLEKIRLTVPGRVDSMGGNSVCHFLNGLGLLYDGVEPGSLDPVLKHGTVSLMDDQTHALNLAQLLRGIASLGYGDNAGVIRIAMKQLVIKFDQLSDSDIADVVWALGRLKSPHSGRFMMKVQTKAKIKGFGFGKTRMSPEEVLRFVWGMDQLNYKLAGKQIIKKLCSEVVYRKFEFSTAQNKEFINICKGMGITVSHLLKA